LYIVFCGSISDRCCTCRSESADGPDGVYSCGIEVGSIGQNSDLCAVGLVPQLVGTAVGGGGRNDKINSGTKRSCRTHHDCRRQRIDRYGLRSGTNRQTYRRGAEGDTYEGISGGGIGRDDNGIITLNVVTLVIVDRNIGNPVIVNNGIGTCTPVNINFEGVVCGRADGTALHPVDK